MDGQSELERRMIGEAPGLNVMEDQNGRTVIRGYAAVYDSESQDLGGFVEVIERGAFDEVMRTNPDVFGRYNHDRLLARTSSGTMKLELDDRGLRYTIYPKPQDADVVESISRGDVRGSSFAFRVSGPNERWEKNGKGQTLRRILRFNSLHDAGPVDTPAYLATETYVAKRALEHARAETTQTEPTSEQRADSPVVETPVEPAAAPAQEDGENRAVAAGEETRALAEGDFVAWDGGVGRIEHLMTEGMLGYDGSEHAMEATPDDPVALVRKWESEDGIWEETDEFVGKRVSDLVVASQIMGEVAAMVDERAVNLKPTAGMAAAAKRGLRLHEEGKSGDGLKPETVARANKLARREEMNPDWVREMNAWFARHESASKSPGWDKPGAEKPGFVAWLLWGGTPAKNFAKRKVAALEAEAARSASVQVEHRDDDFVGKAAALKAALLSTHLHGARRA